MVNFMENEKKPTREYQSSVSFPQVFTNQPKVILTMERIDLGQFIELTEFKVGNERLPHAVERYDITASNISNTSFLLKATTWGQNLFYGFRIAWTAIAEE